MNYKGKNVFYGWIIVAGLAVVIMVSTGLVTINYGLFIGPITGELGFSQAVFGWAQTARLVGVALSGILIGRTLDKYGPRIPLMIVSFFVVGAMLALSAISSEWQIIAIFLLIGFLGIQPGAGNLYAVVPVSQWFIKKRGKALSLMLLGWPIGIFFITPLTQLIIENTGWRNSLILLGIAFGTIIFLVSFLLKRRPQDIGLLPDGDRQDRLNINSETKDESWVSDYSWTRTEALHLPAFWKLTMCSSILFLCVNLTGVYRIPYFVSLGFNPQIVSFAISLEAAVSIGISFLMVYVLPRIQVRYVMAISSLGSALCFVIMIFSTEIWHIFIAEAIFGATVHSQLISDGVIWPSYLGKAHIGNIRGLAVPLTMLISLAGLPLVGVTLDKYGTYLPMLWGMVFLMVLSAGLFIITAKPIHDSAQIAGNI